jgi:hypothetical protein
MWRWIKHWADWLRYDWLPLSRLRRGGSSIHIRHEIGVESRDALPVPWWADSVTVEAQLRLPANARRKGDFLLQFPDMAPLAAEVVRPEHGTRHRIVFRFPPPGSTTHGVIVWKRQPVAEVVVPVLTANQFLSSLTLESSAIAVRYCGGLVPAALIVLDGVRSLLATTALSSPFSLAHLAEIGLIVAFRSERSGRTYEVPVPLSAEQRAATTTVVAAVCPHRPKGLGGWSVVWRAGGRDLAARRAEAISARRFQDSIRVADARFVVEEKTGLTRIVRQAPAASAVNRFGPCFLVASQERGAAGLCRLTLFATTPGEGDPIPLASENVLVTDAPTAFVPGLFAATDMTRVGAFELRLNDRVLGTASLSPVPPATLNAEGGFKPPPNFTWTTAAEEELLNRLGRLGREWGK